MREKLFGPWQYRRFGRWADGFIRVMPWLWFGGLAALFAVSVFRLDQRYGVTMGIVDVPIANEVRKVGLPLSMGW